MKQRQHFVDDYYRQLFTMTELCARYGVSRKTGYKWLERYEEEGWSGLDERSRAPRSYPLRTPDYLEQHVVAMRKKHPSWGGRKIIAKLGLRDPQVKWPSPSIATEILRRHGFVKPRRRRRKVGHPGAPQTQSEEPNDIWTSDYKGQFRVGTGEYCYPLTVVDDFSRYLLGCDGLTGTKAVDAKKSFTRLFREYGLPRIIRTDNGTPFATSNALLRLSQLSVWWIKLGIRPELIEPGQPQQNGRHERMHKTMKKEATRPPAATIRGQHRKLLRFREEYNEERPHEGIGLVPPGSIYVPSPRPFPSRLQKIEYPGHFEVRRVSRNSGIRWGKAWINVSSTLAEEYIGLEEIDDGVWSVYFSDVLLGRFEERERVIYGAHCR